MRKVSDSWITILTEKRIDYAANVSSIMLIDRSLTAGEILKSDFIKHGALQVECREIDLGNSSWL